MYVCMCTGALGSQKRALDDQQLELRVVVYRHVDAENQTIVLCKNS